MVMRTNRLHPSATPTTTPVGLLGRWPAPRGRVPSQSLWPRAKSFLCVFGGGSFSFGPPASPEVVFRVAALPLLLVAVPSSLRSSALAVGPCWVSVCLCGFWLGSFLLGFGSLAVAGWVTFVFGFGFLPLRLFVAGLRLLVASCFASGFEPFGSLLAPACGHVPSCQCLTLTRRRPHPPTRRRRIQPRHSPRPPPPESAHTSPWGGGRLGTI